VHRDRTPTPPDITPGITARGHARPAPGVPHTVRTPLRVRERRGDLHHFVVFPPPTREESPSPPPHVGADQRPSPGTALSPPPPPWRDPRPARESPSPPPHLRRRSTAYIWHDSAHAYIQSFFPDARVTPLPRGFRFFRYACVGIWVTQYSKPRVKITVNPGHWRAPSLRTAYLTGYVAP
jgi:hypothetical protein